MGGWKHPLFFNSEGNTDTLCLVIKNNKAVGAGIYSSLWQGVIYGNMPCWAYALSNKSSYYLSDPLLDQAQGKLWKISFYRMISVSVFFYSIVSLPLLCNKGSKTWMNFTIETYHSKYFICYFVTSFSFPLFLFLLPLWSPHLISFSLYMYF